MTGPMQFGEHPLDDETIVREIRECIEVGNYEIAEDHDGNEEGRQHPDPHRAEEGFNLEDMLTVVLTGVLIERRDFDDRYLFAGRVSGMPPAPLYRGNGLHVVIEWVPEAQVVIVSAYRPLMARWVTIYKRR